MILNQIYKLVITSTILSSIDVVTNLTIIQIIPSPIHPLGFHCGHLDHEDLDGRGPSEQRAAICL